jgi:hypothetical protein
LGGRLAFLREGREDEGNLRARDSRRQWWINSHKILRDRGEEIKKGLPV